MLYFLSIFYRQEKEMDEFFKILTDVNNEVNSVIWGTLGLVLLIGTGVLMTILTKFFQLTHLKL